MRVSPLLGPISEASTRSVVHGGSSPPFTQTKTAAGSSRATAMDGTGIRPARISSPSSFDTARRRGPEGLSRIRFRLDSAGPGHPLGSLDLSGQRPLLARTPHL